MEIYKKIIDKFKSKNILVIGDLILDEYVFGSVCRINPEAPVPVLNAKKREYRLGGAANVANNLISLGGACTVIGQVGYDEARKVLVNLLADIKCYLIENTNFSTIKKTRFIAKNQQTIRVDWETPKKINQEQVDKILKHVSSNDYDLIIISDYDKGVVVPSLMSGLKEFKIPIVADPKPSNINLFKNVFAITPNIHEAENFTGLSNVKEIGEKVVRDFNTNLILTRGEDGASLFDKQYNHYYLPARAKEVYDLSGAGDTFISALALAIASGASLFESVVLGNQAASVVVGKIGTATLSSSELLVSFGLQNSKLKEEDELKFLIKDLQSKGKKVVFTNGCFDLLHVGHTKLLNTAKSFGDVLVLALNTDNSIRKLKGLERPINSENDRAEVLSNLNSVDYMVFFNEIEPSRIIGNLKPDVHVKGGDYDPNDYKRMPEAKVVHEYGGEVKIIPMIWGRSTSNIIRKLK